MADRDSAEERQTVGAGDLGALPAVRGPILDQPTELRQIERLGSRRAGGEAIEFLGHLATRGSQPLVPVATVEAETPVLDHGPGKSVGEYTSRQHPIGPVPKELIGRDREAEFDQPNI